MTKVPVPLCDQCWKDKTGGLEPPVVVRSAPLEQCALCGSFTTSGIYIREDLENVQYPPARYDEP